MFDNVKPQIRYALNLADDGRILSATYPEFAHASAVIVDALPDGDITDYIFDNGEFVYEPLPMPELPVPTLDPTERIAALEAAMSAIEEGIASV